MKIRPFDLNKNGVCINKEDVNMTDKMERYIEKEAENIRKEIEEKNLSNIQMTPEQSERIWKNICEILRSAFGDDYI